MLLVTRLFDSLPLVMTHDQHDEDLVRHQLQALDGGGAGAGGRGGDSSKSSPVSGQLLVYHRLGRQVQEQRRGSQPRQPAGDTTQN